MIKYTPSNQLTLAGFSHPFDNELSPGNRWVKLAQLIPWDALAPVYSKELSPTSGRESIDVRMVIGATTAKHRLGLDDRGTVTMIGENIYLQYFCGLASFQVEEPFHPTVSVDIRKRMGAGNLDVRNALIIERPDVLRPNKKKTISKDKDNGPSRKEDDRPNNRGTLKIDATVANRKIVFPTGAGLLNTARKESERTIDLLYRQSGLDKEPRDHRRIARTEYLVFSKKRRRSNNVIRKSIRKQLGYVKRNLSHIGNLLDHIEAQRRKGQLVEIFPDMEDPYPCRFPISKRGQKIYWVIQLLYQQQNYMYQQKAHSVENRIVNIYRPYVRPIPRGKDRASTEFGAKISAGEVDGMGRAEHIGRNNFNGSIDVTLQVEIYRTTYGHYPELLLAGRIYLNRKNRKWPKEKSIRIVGKPLGRPPKKEPSAYQKRKLKEQRDQRNLIEGKFGQAKNAYGPNNIQAKRNGTPQSWIGAIFFIVNLITLTKIAHRYAIFCAFLKKGLLAIPFNEINQNLLAIFNLFENKHKNGCQIIRI